MAATGKEVVYQGAYGKRDLSKDDAMTVDSVFWIASMTKAVTSAAGMQLVEQGKLSLDEPIGKAESGIPHGWRRPLWHRGRLHQVHPDDPQQGSRQRQPGAEGRDRRDDGTEPH